MRLALVLLVLIAFAPPLSSQQNNPFALQPGDVIRLNAPLPEDPLVPARVVTAGPVILGFSIEGDDRVYNRSFEAIDTLHVRTRSPRYSARSGGVWGAYLGTATGLISGAFLAPKMSLETGTSIALVGGTGGVVGALAGAAIGAVIAPARWYRYVRVPRSAPQEP